jgi:small subunit ribosomal protein S2
MFVATKKQAKEIVKDAAKSVNMPYITERWYGGMLTNFSTIRKSIKKMDTYDKMVKDGTINNLNKRERLMMARENEKLDRTLGGIAQLNRLPAAVFVVDINKEHIAIAEATKLNVKTFALVDTNCDPTKVDFAVPGNDDAAKSVQVITDYLVSAIKEGLEERKHLKDNPEPTKKSAEPAKAEEVAEVKTEAPAKEEVKAEKAPVKKATPVKEEAKAEKAAPKKATTAKKEVSADDAPAKKAPAKKAPAKKAAAKKPAAKKETTAKAVKEEK